MMTPPTKTLVNMGSRERSLIYAYVLMNGDKRSMKEYFDFDLTILIVGEGSKGKITTWYQPEELEENKRIVVEKIKSDPSFYEIEKSNFFIHWSELLKYIIKEKNIESFKEAYNLYEYYHQWWSALSFTLDATNVSEKIKNEYQAWRIENEKYTEEIDKLFLNYLLKVHPEYDSIKNIITPDEMLFLEDGPFTAEKLIEIESRSKGYVLYNYHTSPISDLDEILKKSNITLDKEEPTEQFDSLNGVIACKGHVKGKARVILYKEELAELQEGEILIAEATTPEYVPAIKRVLAVVTDEGGMMSHAAITCRELKKPCIVGTTWATKTFKTGEMVEVIALEDKGTVRKI